MTALTAALNVGFECRPSTSPLNVGFNGGKAAFVYEANGDRHDDEGRKKKRYLIRDLVFDFVTAPTDRVGPIVR